MEASSSHNSSLREDNKSEEWLLTKAGELLNSIIHTEIAKVRASHDYKDPIDIEEEMKMIDPLLHALNVKFIAQN